MPYTIIKSEQRDESILTTIVYTIDGNILPPIEIPHYMPESKDAVIAGIEMREASEKRRLDAIVRNQQILTEL